MYKIVQFLLVSRTELLVGPIVSLVVLVGSTLQLIISRVTNTATEAVVVNTSIKERFSDVFNRISDASITTDIVTILLWTMIGASIYLFITYAISLFSEAIFSISSEMTFVHNKNYKRGEMIRQFIARMSIRIIFAVAFVFYMGTLLSVIWPYSRQLFIDFINNPLSASVIGGALLAWLLLLIGLHIAVVLLRFMLLRSRLSKNEA